MTDTINGDLYCTFYIVRHGETEWNVKRLLQGQHDSPLTKAGEQQAHELGKELASIQFDAVFSSDLLRAKRTAETIALEKKMAVTTTQILRERSFGRFEGRAYEEMNQELRAEVAQFESLSDEEKKSFKLAPDIENDEEIISRLITFLREVAIAYAGKTVLVVTHGGMMRAFLTHLGFATYQEMQTTAIKNAAYIKLQSDGVEYKVTDTVGIEKRPHPSHL